MLSDLIFEICKIRNEALSAACRGAQINYATLRSQLQHGRKVPFESIDALADYWGLPLSHFSSFEAQKVSPDEAKNKIDEAIDVLVSRIESDFENRMARGGAVNIEALLDWLSQHDGVLENYDYFSDYIDLYHPVSKGDSMPIPFRTGPLSLASEHFGIESEEHFHKIVSAFPEQVRSASVEAQLHARTQSYAQTDLDIDIIANGNRVLQTYRRIIAPVKTPDGQQMTLVFCKLLPFKRTKYAQIESAGLLLPHGNSAAQPEAHARQ